MKEWKSPISLFDHVFFLSFFLFSSNMSLQHWNWFYITSRSNPMSAWINIYVHWLAQEVYGMSERKEKAKLPTINATEIRIFYEPDAPISLRGFS